MIKSSLDFALFILLGGYYDSMDVSLTPILDSLIVSNSYRFVLSALSYHIPKQVIRAARTTNQIHIAYRHISATISLIDKPCLLISLDFTRSNIRFLDVVGRVREKHFAAKDPGYFATLSRSGQ